MIYDANNIFAKIIRGEIPADKVYEDDEMLAFHDISKAAPIHVLVIPKGQYVNFADFMAKADSMTIRHFFKQIVKIAEMLDLQASGYRLISNTGPDAAQSVPHFHVHILGKKKLGGLVSGDRGH